MKEFESVYKAFSAARQAKNLKRRLIPIQPEKQARIKVEGKDYINFASNDYLGLTQNKTIQQRAFEWAKQYGNGSGASRLVTGNIEGLTALEKKLAKFKKKPAALILASGFQANAAVLQALMDKSVLKATPFVAADRLNHASMHFGCAAAGVKQHRYRHLDSEHCETLLTKAQIDAPKLILTETVFSMDGDVAPIARLSKIAKQASAMLIADDAHGFGILGDEGRGLSGNADLVIGTFSKALGCFGAYVAGSKAMIDYLIQKCTGLIYSTALPPMVLGAIDGALDLVPELDKERELVKAYANQFRAAAHDIGLDTGNSKSQIVPLIVGDEAASLQLAGALREEGLWVTPIRPPTVAKGTARLRIAFSAAHKQADVDKLINAVARYAKEQGMTRNV